MARRMSLAIAGVVLGTALACTPPRKAESPEPEKGSPPSGSSTPSTGTGTGQAGGGGGNPATSARASSYAGIGALILGPAAAIGAEPEGGDEPQGRAPTEADLEPREIEIVAAADAPRLKRATIEVSDPGPDGVRKVTIQSELVGPAGERYVETREGQIVDGTDGMRHFRWLGPPETKRVRE